MNNQRPVVALFPAHPAQLWVMHTIAEELSDKVEIVWILRDKDVLLAIAEKLKIKHIIISKAKTGIFGNMTELLVNIFRAISLTKKLNIDLWLTKYGAGNIASILCGKQSISFNNDDIDIVPLIAATSYPFAKKIIAPKWVRMGRYDDKTIRYTGYQELTYLHPSRFSPDVTKLRSLGVKTNKQYLLIRMSALTAHHDVGIRGIPEQFLDRIIDQYSASYKIFISSEKPLAKRFTPYHLHTDVDDIHHILHFAACIITDSLTMALEAAILGTASVRLSDFSLQVSGFQAIEKYGLIHNYSPTEIDDAIKGIDKVLTQTTNGEISKRSVKFLDDMEDPLPYYTSAILHQLWPPS